MIFVKMLPFFKTKKTNFFINKQCCGSSSLWCGSGFDLSPWCGSGFWFYLMRIRFRSQLITLMWIRIHNTVDKVMCELGAASCSVTASGSCSGSMSQILIRYGQWKPFSSGPHKGLFLLTIRNSSEAIKFIVLFHTSVLIKTIFLGPSRDCSPRSCQAFRMLRRQTGTGTLSEFIH